MKDEVVLDGNHLVVKDQYTRIISGGEPGTIPWDAFDVDVVIDATGRFLKREELAKHLNAGAKRVFTSQNPKELKTIKEKLFNNLNNSPLYDTTLFVQHLETAYLKMYDRLLNNLNPDHIYVKH